MAFSCQICYNDVIILKLIFPDKEKFYGTAALL